MGFVWAILLMATVVTALSIFPTPAPSPIFNLPSNWNFGAWRELFPQRQIVPKTFGSNLPPNTCAPDSIPNTPWRFRRRLGPIVHASSATDAGLLVSEGDWLRFSGFLVVLAQANISAPASNACSQYFSWGPFVPTGGYYIAPFVMEYRYTRDSSQMCGYIVKDGSGSMAYASKEFNGAGALNTQLVQFYNEALYPLLSQWTIRLASDQATSLLPASITQIDEFCSLRFIQCLSIESTTYPFEQLNGMFPFLHPSIYSAADMVGVDSSLFNYGNITGYAVLLGGDSIFSLQNPVPLNWTLNGSFGASLDAMFMLDLSFHPFLQLALNAPLNLRVLLLSGSPGIELQYSGQGLAGISNRSDTCSDDYCVNPGKAKLDFSGSGSGAHPQQLKVLGLSVNRSNYNGFYLRTFSNLMILQVDDGDFSYPGAYESVYALDPLTLAAQVNDAWPRSVLPKYDSSCRDMYFDRYFLYGDSFLSITAPKIPDNWDRTITPTPGTDPQFTFECWLPLSTPMMHFSVFGLPLKKLQSPNSSLTCFGSALQTLQIEGSLLTTSQDLFINTTADQIFNRSQTVRLSHNVRLQKIDDLLAVPLQNLLVYGNSRLNLASTKPALTQHIDASFSNVLSAGWKGLAWTQTPSITCRECGASTWPTITQTPSIVALRMPMNPLLTFNMSEFGGVNMSLGTQNAWDFAKSFSTAGTLQLLDVSYCKVLGHFPKYPSPLPFPSRISFAYNFLKAYQYDETYHPSDKLFPSAFNLTLSRISSMVLRGNGLTGPEPSFFPLTSGATIDISGNQISCPTAVTTSSSCSSMAKQPSCSPWNCGGGQEYCSWPLLNELPRFLSSFESSPFDIKFNNSFLLSAYESFANCASNTTFLVPSPSCRTEFCAFLKFGDNTRYSTAVDRALLTDASSYYHVKFTVGVSLASMSSICATANQMPSVKDSIVTGCEVSIELYFGNQSHVQKYMTLPPVMLIAQCGAGKQYSGGNCEPCSINSFSPKPDVDWTITARCQACPRKAVTLSVGSTRLQDCFCPNSTFGDPVANQQACALVDADCCRDCPPHTECIYPKNKMPMPNDGYILDVNNAALVIECVPRVACKNNNCTDGYTGDTCSQCAPKHYRLQQECPACPSADGFVVFLGILIFFGASLFLLKASKPDISKIYTISITVGFVQIISIFASFPVSWPKAATFVFDFFSFVNFNIDLFSPECALDLNFYEKWGLKMGMPLMLVGFFFIIFLVVRFIPFLRKYYIKFLLWKILDDLGRIVPKSRKNGPEESKAQKKLDGDFDSFATEYETGSTKDFRAGKEQLVVRSLNSLPLSASKRNLEADIQVSLGLEKVVPLSAAAQYEIDREWEEAHLSNRFTHAFVTSCCLGYTFLAKTSTQVFNCVSTGGGVFIRYDPSVACYNDEWYQMEAASIFAILVYTFGIPLFFSVTLVRGWRKGVLETPEFYQHYGQLVLPYRAQYWYWELVQISRKLIVVLLIDFGANTHGDNTYTQISGVLIVLLLFLVLQEFIKPYEFTWCNRLAFTWTAISLLVLVSALFFVVGSLTEDQRSEYGVGLLISCILGLLISAYTAFRESRRALAKTRVAPSKDFLSSGQEEQAVVNTIFGRSIGEPLYRKTRGLDPTARAGFYQQLVRLHTGLEIDETKQGLSPEVEISQVRTRLTRLESKVAGRASSGLHQSSSVSELSMRGNNLVSASSPTPPTASSGPPPLLPLNPALSPPSPPTANPGPPPLLPTANPGPPPLLPLNPVSPPSPPTANPGPPLLLPLNPALSPEPSS